MMELLETGVYSTSDTLTGFTSYGRTWARLDDSGRLEYLFQQSWFPQFFYPRNWWEKIPVEITEPEYCEHCGHEL